MIIVELNLENYEISSLILEILMKHKLSQGFWLADDGHYRIKINCWSDIPKSLTPFIKSTPIELANNEILELIENDPILSQKYEVYHKVL